MALYYLKWVLLLYLFSRVLEILVVTSCQPQPCSHILRSIITRCSPVVLHACRSCTNLAAGAYQRVALEVVLVDARHEIACIHAEMLGVLAGLERRIHIARADLKTWQRTLDDRRRCHQGQISALGLIRTGVADQRRANRTSLFVIVAHLVWFIDPGKGRILLCIFSMRRLGIRLSHAAARVPLLVPKRTALHVHGLLDRPGHTLN